jgi:excisionase family DNA binding protein
MEQAKSGRFSRRQVASVLDSGGSPARINDFLTPEQICRLLSIKKSTLYSWTSNGLIPYFKVNGLVRFKEDKIRAWLKMKERGIIMSRVEGILADIEGRKASG